MYVRCAECQASTWVNRAQPLGEAEVFSCAECGAARAVSPEKRLGETIGSHYRRTQSFAQEHSIDPASAYSVLLGLTSLETVRRLRLEAAGTGPPVARLPGSLLVAEYDPAFEDAVAAGVLPVQEAHRRGNRQAYAVGISRRHRLPMDLSFKVADNRLRLKEAFRRAALRRWRPAATLLETAVILAIGGALAFGVTHQLWKYFDSADLARIRATGHAPPPAVRAESPAPIPREKLLESVTEVRRNESLEVVAIVGPDPATVLVSFCRNGPSTASREPLEITPTVTANRQARLGLFRDKEDLGRLRAIRIRRDAATRRWIAGDGSDPIPVLDAPDLPMDARRIPVPAGSARD